MKFLTVALIAGACFASQVSAGAEKINSSFNTFIVDAFTSVPFGGNPAGVVILDHEVPAERMLKIAAEMAASETAFVWPIGEDFGLKWFSSKAEVQLCGHATLAAAHVLWNEIGLNKKVKLRFHTASGLLVASHHGSDGVELDFPTLKYQQIPLPEQLKSTLADKVLFVGKQDHRIILELKTAADVRNFAPNFDTLMTLEHRGVLITAKSDNPKWDFISRYFAPKIGVPEDPVTGSAHCVLAPYWEKKLGKTEFVAYQASSRGGELKVRLRGERTSILGPAVTVFKGQMAI